MRLEAVAIFRGEQMLRLSKGGSHSQLRQMHAAAGHEDYMTSVPGDIEGFVTDSGLFLTRREAVPVAIAAGQLRAAWKDVHRPVLSSDIHWDAQP